MQAEKQFLCIMQTVGVVLLKKKKIKRRKKPLRRLVNTQWAEEPRLMALLYCIYTVPSVHEGLNGVNC